MDSNEILAREIAGYVRKQDETNQELKTNVQELRANVQELRANTQELKELNKRQDDRLEELRLGTQETRELHRSQDRWMRKMFQTHETWLKDHERRIVNLYKFIQRG